MRLMFVYSLPRNRGYAYDVRTYMQVAERMGHEVVLYGRPHEGATIERSTDIESADGVVLIMEWFYKLDHDQEALRQLLNKVPRRRRVIVDSDGMYNDVIAVDGDYNHPDEASSRQRMAFCDELSDKIYQTTPTPRQPHVGSFLFAGYEADRAQPLDAGPRDYAMCYVGNNWFRWRPMKRVLAAIEPIRERCGRIGIVGNGWNEVAQSVSGPLREAACFTDPAYLAALGVELIPAVPVADVRSWMGKGRFSPLLIRPLYEHLSIVTPHVFETFTANTIPILVMPLQYATGIYGEEASGLVLKDDASGHILDVLERPTYYLTLVDAVRRRLAAQHTHEARLTQLIEIVNS